MKTARISGPAGGRLPYAVAALLVFAGCSADDAGNASTVGSTTASGGGVGGPGAGGASGSTHDATGGNGGAGGGAGTAAGSGGSGGSGGGGRGGGSGGGTPSGTGGVSGAAGAGGNGGTDAPRDGGPEGSDSGMRREGGSLVDAFADAPAEGTAEPKGIQYVFIVLEENHDWSSTKNLPYMQELLRKGAHSEQYYNPRGLHPSEPNYVWLEAGSNHGITNDADPSASHLVKGAPHLTTLLEAKGISWTSYQEDIAPGTCPIASHGAYAAKHDPFLFFDDVVGNPPSATSRRCVEHHKPFTQFLPDLKSGAVARYNFITPNLQNDMHDGSPARGDQWLRTNIDPIVNPASPNHNASIYAHAVLIITWDEGAGTSDGPIGIIVVSPFAKPGFSDTTTPTPYYYTHSSTLLSLQKIFGVADTPLGDAARARDLGALFTTFP